MARRLLVLLVAALALAAPAQATNPAPRLTAVAGVNVFTVPWQEWPTPLWDAYYLNFEPDGSPDQGIYLSPKIYPQLVRALNGHRPVGLFDRLDLADAIYVLGHELYHAQEGPTWADEEAATRYGQSRPVFLRLAGRLGISGYDRRALWRAYTHGAEPAP